jgi:hypothetical protein
LSAARHRRQGKGAIATWAAVVVGLLVSTTPAHGQAGGGSRATELVVMTTAYVDECRRADDLLRQTCARIGAQLSDRNKGNCALPAESFAARTARSYAAFRATYRAEIQDNEARIAGLLKTINEDFDRQFAQLRAGKVSMLDLETLNRLLRDRCSTIENEWLAPGRNPR